MTTRTEAPARGNDGGAFDEAVAGLARAMMADRRVGGLPRGDISALRRMEPDAPAAAFWQLVARHVPDRLCGTPEDERAWALVVKGMAIMAPNVHAPGQNPGQVYASLARSGSFEVRTARLVSAEDDAFESFFLRACRTLAAKGAAVDWRQMARLAVYQDAEARRQFAKDFWKSARD